MKKQIFGRQFKRDVNERKALFKGLMSSLVMHERIQTTEQKAKAIKGSIEKLVTKAKKQGAAAERLLLPYLPEPAAKKLIGDIAPRFANRPGGYTRIIRVGKRFQDNASVVIIEWVERSTQIVSAEGRGRSFGKAQDKGAKSNDTGKTETVAATAAVATGKEARSSGKAGSGQAKKEVKKKEDKKETKVKKTTKKEDKKK